MNTYPILDQLNKATYCLGEQVDLSAFPPVCLPALGQSFAGLDGVVAGEVHVPAYIFCLSCFNGFLAGWGLTETNFSSDSLKEVEVGGFLFSASCGAHGKFYLLLILMIQKSKILKMQESRTLLRVCGSF